MPVDLFQRYGIAPLTPEPLAPASTATPRRRTPIDLFEARGIAPAAKPPESPAAESPAPRNRSRSGRGGVGTYRDEEKRASEVKASVRRSQRAANSEKGITGPIAAAKNVGYATNRALGRLTSAADYALLGFLDDTPEGAAKRPLGAAAQYLKGEKEIPENVPLVGGSAMARDPTTIGEEYWQSAGDAIAQSVVPTAGLVAAGNKLALRGLTEGARRLAPYTVAEPVKGAGRIARTADTTKRGAQHAADTVRRIPEAGRTLARTSSDAFRQAPLTAAAGELVAATGAGFGREAGQGATPGSQAGPIIGEIVGGMAPTTASALSPVMNAFRLGRHFVGSSGAEMAAARQMERQIGGELRKSDVVTRAQRAKEVQEATGTEMSLGQQTGSPALLNTERELRRRASPEQLDQDVARDRENLAKIQEFTEANAPRVQGSTGRPEDARDVFRLQQQRQEALEAGVTGEITALKDERDRLRQERAELPNRGELARQRQEAERALNEQTMGARVAATEPLPNLLRVEQGRTLREGIATKRTAAKEEMNRRAADYGLTDLDFRGPYRDFARAAADYMRGLPKTVRKYLPPTRAFFRDLARKGRVELKDVTSLHAALGRDIRDARAATDQGRSYRRDFAITLQKMLEERVFNEEADLFRAADPNLAAAARNYTSRPDLESALADARLLDQSAGDVDPGLRAEFEAMGIPWNPDSLALDPGLQALDQLGINWRRLNPAQIRDRLAEVDFDPAEMAGVNERYRQFRREYWDTVIDPFERGAVEKVRKLDGRSYLITPDEKVAESLMSTFDSASQFRKAANGDPALEQAFVDSVLDELGQLRNNDTGVIRSGRITDWIKNREGMLEAFPEVRQYVTNLRDQLKAQEDLLASGTANLRAQQTTRETEIAARRREIQAALEPMRKRMEVHQQRLQALQDTALARQLNRMNRGALKPDQLVRQAVADDELMGQVLTQAAKDPEALAALQRHVWNDVGGMSGPGIKGYMLDNAKSLSMLFGKKHIENLMIIADAKEMADALGPMPQGRAINLNPMEAARDFMGQSPQSMVGSGLGFARGRSSPWVEGAGFGFRFIAGRQQEAVDRVMRAALFNKQFANDLIQSGWLRRAANQTPTFAERSARKAIRSHMWAMGLQMGPPTDEETHTFGPLKAEVPDRTRRVRRREGN